MRDKQIGIPHYILIDSHGGYENVPDRHDDREADKGHDDAVEHIEDFA